MKLNKALELIKQYCDCPECGNDKIGGGAGTLEVEGESFKRTCICGWSIEVEGSKPDVPEKG